MGKLSEELGKLRNELLGIIVTARDSATTKHQLAQDFQSKLDAEIAKLHDAVVALEKEIEKVVLHKEEKVVENDIEESARVVVNGAEKDAEEVVDDVKKVIRKKK